MLLSVEPYSLINFRGDLIQALVKKKFEVVAMGRNASAEQISKLESFGCRYINYSVARTGLNPFFDLWTLMQFIIQIRNEAPTHVLAYTIKPVIWGGIACKFFPRTKFVGMITGLGFAFGEGGSLRKGVNYVARLLYKIALSDAEAVIFQNEDNRSKFEKISVLPRGAKITVVNGSGVNLSLFSFQPVIQEKSKLIFLMIGRLLKDKGVSEFLAAAEMVKRIYHEEVEFVLVGPEDSSPNAIKMVDVLDSSKQNIVSYLGELNDIRDIITKASVFVLPSYHEGTPRTVLEAMAIGRPIITTNVPGCRGTVIDGLNGWLVPKENVAELAEKIIWFMENPDKISKMGAESRKYVAEKFDVNLVNEDIIEVITSNS